MGAVSVLETDILSIISPREDKEKGRVTHWNSVEEMFDTILGE